MLQTACMSPELLVNPNMSESEICGYSPGQGSPLPGETASPKSCFQQSPSLPDSGLTELNVASPKIYHPPPPPCKPPGMPAPADSELSSDPPQKRYMGVRVKMPVRELLRKIRLSKGVDVAHGKEASSVKMATKGSSGKTAEKRRAHPYTEKQLRQSKQNAGQSPKGLEDLDILVEVLQEDLNKSQLREEPLHPVPDGAWQGFSRDPQSSRWERAASKEAAGDPQGREPWGKDFHPILPGRQRSSAGLLQEPWGKNIHLIPQGRQRSSAGLLQEPWGKDLQPMLRAEAELCCPGEQGSPHGCSPPGMLCRTAGQGSGCWVRDALPSCQEGFPRDFPAQDVAALLRPAEMLLEAPRGSPDAQGHSRLAPMSFPQQDPSAFSFFQFQLRREESLLRSIPAEKLLAPDENGNRLFQTELSCRLLHKAVVQGRRALTFALAQRFASLNKIDEKDAQKRTALHLAAEKNQHLMVSDLISLGASVNEQDSSGKTPLHLCAENGYLRVLQVLKNCKDSGVRVEVDVPDHYGLTPLHRAALAHTLLVPEAHGTAGASDRSRLLTLRREQILEGILCLLQMGAKPQLQVLNSCPTSTTCLRVWENTELMGLLQAHKPQGQDVLQESYSLLDAPRGTPSAPAADSLPELCAMASSELFDVLLKGKC